MTAPGDNSFFVRRFLDFRMKHVDLDHLIA